MRFLHPHLVSRVAAAILVLGANPAALAAQTQSVSQAAPWDVTQPRGQTRKISFTTDEGTWLSPDVSPDGRTIVFDMVGDIWIVPIGCLHCLLSGSVT